MHGSTTRSADSRASALVCALLAACALAPLVAPRPAAGEGFFDIYMGASFPEDGDVDASGVGGPFMGVTSISGRADYDTSFTTGLRGGYWFEDEIAFLGLGLDASYYGFYEDTSFVELDIAAFPLTPLLMVRIPIARSEAFPGGRVQPYGAVGPSFTVSVATVDVDDIDFGFDEDFADASFDVGLDARGGIAVQVAKPFALFLEYRFTHLRPDYDDEVDYDFGPDADIDVEPDLDAHHLIFGASFRF